MGLVSLFLNKFDLLTFYESIINDLKKIDVWVGKRMRGGSNWKIRSEKGKEQARRGSLSLPL